MLGTNGPMTQRALAEVLGVSARNVTGLVDALVATGRPGRLARAAPPGDGPHAHGFAAGDLGQLLRGRAT